MNVTLVCDVLGPENNGTTIAAMNLMRSLRAKGHKVNVLCPDADKMGKEGYYVVPTMNLGPLNGYVKNNGVSLAKPDRRILRAAMADADIVHVMVPFALGLAGAKEARKLGLPLSAGFHAMAENFTTHIFMQDSKMVNRLTYSAYARLYKQCDAIHYPTQFLRDLYEGMYGPTNGYVISNGVNSYVRPKEVTRPEEFEGKFVILSTGRFSEEKAQSVLIDAVDLSAHRDRIQLILAGAGPLEEKLKKRAAKLPNQPILCFFTREEMVRLLNACDLYVHPAEIEAEGIACLEAITCGLVPVISDSPRCATRFYALDDRSLFHHGNPAHLAQRLDWWIEHPDKLAVYRQKYLSYGHERFDLDACMDQMEQMLLETVERFGGRTS